MKPTARMLATGLALLAAPVAANTRYDFTGHWTGSAMQSGSPSLGLSADLTGVKKFTGNGTGELVPPIQCSVNGTQTGKSKVVLHLKCDDGDKLTFHGRLNVATATIMGSYTVIRPGKHLKHGKFTLVKSA